MRLPKLDSLCHVTWWDICGYINDPLSKVKPVRCVTVGWLIRIEKNYIVIASSIYDGDESDKTIDATALPVGCIESVKRV